MKLVKYEVIEPTYDQKGKITSYIVLEGPPDYGDIVRYEYDNGTVEYKKWAPVPSSIHVSYVFIHVTLSSNEIHANGSDAITINFTLREGGHPESVIKSSINRSWIALLRDDNRNIYDVVKVTFVNGVANISYRTSKPGVVSLINTDVHDKVGSAIVTLANEVTFTAYNEFQNV